MLGRILWVALSGGGLIWVFWRIHLREKKPWKLYKWALGPLPPRNASTMQAGLAVEAKKEDPNVVVVSVRDLQPGDEGWIHEREIRYFRGCLWLHELGRVTSQVRRHNAGFVEIEVDEEGIVVNAPERVQEMTREEQSASQWYFAMRFTPEEEPESDLRKGYNRR